MRKFLVLFAVLVLAVSLAYANPDVQSDEEKGPMVNVCPKLGVSGGENGCMDCHAVVDGEDGFELGVKEFPKFATYDPPEGTVIISREGEPVPWYLVTEFYQSDLKCFFGFFNWVYDHPEFKTVIVEVHSPGGSLFGSQRMVSIIDEAKHRGITVETRCYGFAASAGFYVLVNGSQGHRFVAPEAQLMWHELITFKFLDISSPADKEDEANVLRHLQSTVNNKISKVTGIDKDELDQLIRKKELWASGSQAVEMGFADGLIE